MLRESDNPWNGFTSALDGGDNRAAVDALLHLVQIDRHAAAAADTSPLINLTVTPEYPADEKSDVIVWKASGPSANSILTIPLRLEDLRVAALNEERILNVLAFAMAAQCRGEDGHSWHPHRFGDASPPPVSVVEERLAGYKYLDIDDEIRSYLENGRDVLLVGRLGAGKTTAATSQADHWTGTGGGLIWLDLTDPYDCDESVAYALLSMHRAAGVLLVVDNVQANVSAARGVLDLARQLRVNLGMPMVVLATGSPVVAQVPELSSTQLTRVNADGRVVVRALLDDVDGMSAGDRVRIERVAGGDVFLARIALDLDHIPESREFADLVARRLYIDRLGNDARRLLYRLSCLSLFEIEVSIKHFPFPLEATSLQELITSSLVHRNDESYTVGPRSLGRLLVQYIYSTAAGGAPLRDPARVTYEYLQRAGATQIKATLDKLDLLPFSGEGPGTYIGIASVWGALSFLGDSLENRVRADPTWGDEVSSAAFAGLAMVELGRNDAWQACADLVRSRWSYDRDDELPCWVGTPSADLEAFQRMSDLMQAEYELISTEQGNSQPFEPLDAERACRTWMLGVLLQFEAKAPIRDYSRLDRLFRIAQKTIEGGAFYPAQAPWVTAQVVLGLCLAGYSVDTDQVVVERACRWLCRDKRLGGAYNRGWQNGVSGKTSDVMTTALCLSALLHAGWQWTEHIQTGYENLCAEQALLGPGGQETELALILEARLRKGDTWEELSPAIINLLGWATRPERRSDPDVRATRPGDPLSASAKTPFIAIQLWITIWTTVKRELGRLLREILGMDDIPLFDGSGPGGRGPDGHSPGAGHGSVPEEPIASLNAIRRGVDRIRRETEENINERARRIPALIEASQQPFERELGIWQERLGRLEEIETELEGSTVTVETVNRIDALGSEVFGRGWQAIPRRQRAE
jgi:hypothetical protein